MDPTCTTLVAASLIFAALAVVFGLVGFLTRKTASTIEAIRQTSREAQRQIDQVTDDYLWQELIQTGGR